MARKIVVTSGKGGVGKTTVAVYLAAQLAKKGERVLVCDADFGLNNVDVVTGLRYHRRYRGALSSETSARTASQVRQFIRAYKQSFHPRALRFPTSGQAGIGRACASIRLYLY